MSRKSEAQKLAQALDILDGWKASTNYEFHGIEYSATEEPWPTVVNETRELVLDFLPTDDDQVLVQLTESNGNCLERHSISTPDDLLHTVAQMVKEVGHTISLVNKREQPAIGLEGETMGSETMWDVMFVSDSLPENTMVYLSRFETYWCLLSRENKPSAHEHVLDSWYTENPEPNYGQIREALVAEGYLS